MNEQLLQNDQALRKAFIGFLVPVMLANVLQSLGQVFAMFLVGRNLGVEALAAISAFFPFFFFLMAFAIGIGSGSSILVGQTFGAGNHEKMKEVVGVTLAFTTILSIVVAIFGGFFIEWILRVMHTPDNIFAISVSYARILFFTLPIMFWYFVYTTFMRGVGDSKTPFIFLVISVLLNISFLPPLLFGWFGLPQFGLNGAAYASVLSNFVTMILLLTYLHKTKHILRLDASILKHFKIKKDILQSLLKLAIPASISMVAISVAEIAVIGFVNRYGSDATAAYGVVNQVGSYAQVPAMSIAIATSVFVAQALGANSTDMIKKVRQIGVRINYIFGGAIVLLMYLFAEPILQLFIDSPDTVAIAKNYLFITFWSYIIFGHTQTVSATMRATGVVLWPTIFLVIAIWAIQVPTAYLLSQYTTLDLNGVWIAYPVAFCANFIMQFAYFKLGWQKRTLKAMLSEH
ncbi:MATE family efflux transporter [Lysinibacillus alkalisoli]|uniref:MATE family efflux transporter n=1 Tax=Lysinibacillus alkalisoli TaxID=1911548 RepID=A0A917D495_9BACI|nr:MATE family efflux transporter [Lysinibacillus alkalisoli]GGG11122.1 MATE family efflux transporter [Lysinibacillus alkalisoli]